MKYIEVGGIMIYHKFTGTQEVRKSEWVLIVFGASVMKN